MDYKPKSITRYIEKDITTELASFTYYEGISYVRFKGMKQATSFSQLGDKDCYIVHCACVTIQVTPEDFPDIEREIIDVP